MNSVDHLLELAFDDLSTQAPHDADLVATIRRRSKWRTAVLIAPSAAALSVIVIAVTLIVARPAAGPASAPPASACAPIAPAVLPPWARAGFTDREPTMRYATSRTGAMIAILFVDPLVSPPLETINNKILWVTNDPDSSASTLTIDGTREGGTDTMHAIVDGGPGPSVIDVPVPGCWHLELSWGNHRDSVDLQFLSS